VPEDGYTGDIEDGRLHIRIEQVQERHLESALVSLKD
jgi:hypothetical protein